MKKYYAVKTGFNPGIYETWSECKKEVVGYSGAIYKSFPTMEEAQQYLTQDNVIETYDQEIYAYVDGSFNINTRTYGYGGYLYVHGSIYPLFGSGQEKELASMQNVAGEILGAEAAIRKALSLNLESIIIYYDYHGIKEWADANWKCNNPNTLRYKYFVKDARESMKIGFKKVDAHTGIIGNEVADVVAKFTTGIKISHAEQNIVDNLIKYNQLPEQM